MFSTILRKQSDSVSDLLWTRIIARNMGGGPRTFPGGINKWQWKRLHEKKAREKEKKLLEHEKQLYEARIRSEIRAKLWGKPESGESTANSGQSYGPISPKEHIKGLADRFMKPGAEDLWNEDDGPVKSDEGSRFSPRVNGRSSPNDSSPGDVRKLFYENRASVDNLRTANFGSVNGSSLIKSRNFSAMSRGKFRRNESSCDEDDSNVESKVNTVSPFSRKFAGNKEKVNSRNISELVRNKGLSGRRRFFKNDSSTSEEDSDFDPNDEEGEQKMKGWRDVRKTGSSASLGNYDVKLTKRVHLRGSEEDFDPPMDIECIREDLRKRKSVENQIGQQEPESIYSEKRFSECSISPLTLKAISASGIVKMTRVQDATLSECLDGKDVLVKAKTGTGKSMAFLLPAIETALKAMNCDSVQRVPPVYVLVLCPTRELASQLAAEAKALLKYHDGIGVQMLVGGTRFKLDQQRLESEPCQILIATPGRLLDHIENKSGLTVRLMALKMFILDEADLLLDLGFRRDVEKIVDCLPRQRQSLLFSATIPKEVRRVSQLVLKRDHSYIDTVGVGCVETHEKVKQSCLVASHELHFHVVHQLLKEHIAKTPDYKIIVFCSTGMVTSLMYMLLREMKMNVREIHARKTQLFRTRVSDEFKDAKRLILVTSDVSARGMNYPNVTLVVQVGIPTDREQYIHRLGRTGREGKEGEGVLLIAPWERYFLDELKDLPLERLPVPDLESEVKLQVDDSMAKIDTSVKEAAYHAWLGYYNSIRETGRDKTTLAELANQFCRSIGLQKPPALFRRTAVKMGLKGVPGIPIRK
ncbi:PREDICTED: probable DEAD-box ATP-dependent RNA helicase 48 [Tarenaya hassleriana]|uniref:probable DEAD-box ATP-dependent RNA helicase 48 n=1 Tax=Tarenaya hassleriana TaxID=28532 RepID=UPI00053C5A41|nr:PREDICTED: probable DEAD-box ATP-dependent RNA helicase 48 [Tarenaya hassleriana]